MLVCDISRKMAPLFKDFAKDAKDLVEKNYTDAGAWKVESKYKGGDCDVFINPQVSHGEVSVDVEYNCKTYGLKTKTSVSKKGFDPTVTYEKDGHKVEVVVHKHEVSYEFKSGALTVNDKLSAAAVSAGVAYDVAAGVTVGAEVEYDLKGHALQSWSAGALYKSTLFTAAVTTRALKHYVTGVVVPVDVAAIPNLKFVVFSDCSHTGTKVNVGTEFGCPFGTGFTLRAKVDKSLKVSFAAIRKFADGWKAAFSFDSTFKGVGVYIVRE